MQRFRAILGDLRGNVSMTFAFVTIPLVLGVGAAVDYSRATSLRTQLQGMVDSVTLAAASLPPAQRPASADAALAAAIGGSRVVVASKAWSSAADGSFTGVVSGSMETAFVKIVGVSSMPFNARATAKPPAPLPIATTFTPVSASGWFWKNVTVWIHTPGAASDTQVASYVYQPEYLDQLAANGAAGIGSLTSNPPGTVTFPPYDKLYLRMSVRGNSCPPNQAPATGTGTGGVKLNCVSSPGACSPSDIELRTDDPNTSHHLFVAGAQLPQGVVSPITSILKCGQAITHDWEDGGNFAMQDFRFDVSTTCGSPSWLAARLVN